MTSNSETDLTRILQVSNDLSGSNSKLWWSI